MPNASGAVDLDFEAKTEEQPQPEAAEIPEREEVWTAFAIVVDKTGNPSVVSYEHSDFDMTVAPTIDMVYAACSTVLKDITVKETAETTAQLTIQHQMQMAQQMAQQQQAEQIKARLGGGLRG